MNIAVIFAGGTGKRMNTKAVPKQFLDMHGKPVLIYTAEKFQKHNNIDGIIFVSLDGWIDYTIEIVKKYSISKCLSVVKGGATGQESIYNGLKEAKKFSKNENDIVLIHDGVRPMIDMETISCCIENVEKRGNAITTAPAIETIFANTKDGQVGEIYNRSQCLMARAPQCFVLKDIYEAHLKAKECNINNFIDSAMLMQYYGEKLYTVDGPIENIKITTPTDFYIFRALLDAKENMQIVGI